MARILYLHVSTSDKSVDEQRLAVGGVFDREFIDLGMSIGTMGEARASFAEMLGYVRENDMVCVGSIGQLGRDVLNIHSVISKLLERGVTLDVRGLGLIGRGQGELVIAVLTQIADMERLRIKERCEVGRAAAKVSLQSTGTTRRGKVGMGRPFAGDPQEVVAWRTANVASVAQTAERFGLSQTTVKRYCAA